MRGSSAKSTQKRRIFHYLKRHKLTSKFQVKTLRRKVSEPTSPTSSAELQKAEGTRVSRVRKVYHM